MRRRSRLSAPTDRLPCVTAYPKEKPTDRTRTRASIYCSASYARFRRAHQCLIWAAVLACSSTICGSAGRERFVDYTGVDLSPVLVKTATRLWPEARFLQRDIFEAPFSDQSFDYVIVNGLPTDSEMIDNDARATQTKRLIEVAFRFCRVGVAVDVSQSHGAHQHDAFFAFLADRVTRHVALLGDCGLPYDTAYLYREPNR
ncbi:MAG: class I SAM-dependent methyltransferase [Alphaproteobacteria bacterium]|nr:class I SAM-dependent methyltransferase [Alphaproteobacteria bacterium]